MSRPSGEHLTINASVDSVLQVLRDVATFRLWQPSIERSEVLSTDTAGRPTAASFGARVGPWLSTYSVRLRHSDRGLAWSLEVADLLRRYEGGWSVEPDHHDPARTLVGYELLVVPKAPSPRFIVDHATRAEVRTGLAALAAHLGDDSAAGTWGSSPRP